MELLGNKIQMLRKNKNLSQQELAQMLGLTFQQVQKYEKGLNRVGASRLWDIAQVLHTSMDFYFEDMDEQTAALSPRDKTIEYTHPAPEDDPMHNTEALTLVRNYYKIRNRSAAEHLFEVIADLANSSVVDKI